VLRRCSPRPLSPIHLERGSLAAERKRAATSHPFKGEVTSMTVSDTSLRDGAKCTDEVRDSSPMNGSLETSAYFVDIACALRPRRAPHGEASRKA
jgi:hypothetical protein